MEKHYSGLNHAEKHIVWGFYLYKEALAYGQGNGIANIKMLEELQNELLLLKMHIAAETKSEINSNP